MNTFQIIRPLHAGIKCSMQTKKMVLFLLLIIALCILSYYFIDRQLVWWLVSHHSRDFYLLKIIANQIPNIVGAFVFFFYIYLAISLYKYSLNETNTKLVVMCNSIVIAIFLKDVLKLVFGRFWTSTFTCNNPSLIDNNVYGFNWFNQEHAFASFPSGHATLIFSFSTSMWFLFPTLRWVWSLLAAMVAMGQISMYYHFVSDVLAGAALGGLVAIYNYHYWLRSKHNQLISC